MAIFIPGIQCVICQLPINSIGEAVMFPPFVSNEADALYVFNDAVVHSICFRNHPLSAKVEERYEEFRRRMGPENRKCFVCNKQIMDPDDYVPLGYLVEDVNHPLHIFNYAQLHRSCVKSWHELPEFLRAIEQFDHSGVWKGDRLKYLSNELRRSAAKTV